MSEPREPYNKEDIMLLVQEYREVKERHVKDNWKLARLAHEAAQKADLKDFASKTGEGYTTLKKLSYIAGKYSEDDVKLLPVTLVFEHFIAAAANDKRLEWLQKAGNNGWDTTQLRREMNPPAPKKDPEPIVQPEPEIEEKPKRIYDIDILNQMVESLNWYLFNDKKSLELAADGLTLICLLLNENRRVIRNEITGRYEIV